MQHICRTERYSEGELAQIMERRWASRDHWDLLIPETTDSIRVVNEDGATICALVKKVIPDPVVRRAAQTLRSAATPTNNRKIAAGALGIQSRMIRQDGKRSRTTRALDLFGNPVMVDSGVVGSVDRYSRYPYCRKTAWTAKNMIRFTQSWDLLQIAAGTYSEVCPEPYDLQQEHANRCDPHWIIPGTPFSTVTVNRNYRTAYHYDNGDFKGGMGCMALLSAKDYTGGELVLPRYGIAVDYRPGDILFCDVHQMHGNMPILKHSQSWERLGLVIYLRHKLVDCGTPEEELQRVQRIQTERILQ